MQYTRPVEFARERKIHGNILSQRRWQRYYVRIVRKKKTLLIKRYYKLPATP